MAVAPRCVLGVESSGPLGGVALLDGGRVAGEILFEKGMVHGRDIAPSVRRLLDAARRRPEDLDLIAVDIGPGSYTGVRVGLAAAKGLAVALGRPILGVPSLDAIAEPMVNHGGTLVAAIDARWGQVYSAVYEVRRGAVARVGEIVVETPDAFAARVPAGALVAGDAAPTCAGALTARGVRIAPREMWAPRPSVVAGIARRRFAAGERHDAATLVPLYLRPTEAELKFGTAKEKRERGGTGEDRRAENRP